VVTYVATDYSGGTSNQAFNYAVRHHTLTDQRPFPIVNQASTNTRRYFAFTFAVYKAISLHVYVVIATKHVQRLHIRPTVHN